LCRFSPYFWRVPVLLLTEFATLSKARPPLPPAKEFKYIDQNHDQNQEARTRT
jgi:hypothetical protein